MISQASSRPDTKTIHKALIDKDLSVAELARRLGWSRIYVSYVVNGQRTSRGAQEQIAEALGVPVDEVFPSREEATL